VKDTSDFDHNAALQACASGHLGALQALYDNESRWLLGVALRIVRDRATAEDVLHDAWLQIWHNAGSFDPALGSARGWLYTVVRHRALTAARRAGRDLPLDSSTLDDMPDTHHPAPESNAMTDSLHRCLQQLDDPRRACIVHAYVDGYTHAQIAQRLNAPLGSVKSWIRRGLASLKECLS